MKILKYNKYSFLKENYDNFNQFNIGPSPIPGYGFAVDPQMSIYGSQDSPYVDDYYRRPTLVNSLLNIVNQTSKNISSTHYGNLKFDNFIEDIDEISNFKILKININNNLNIDIYISFEMYEDEFFGVFKNYNWIQKDTLKSDLFTDDRYRYIDKNYILKLDNYFRNILDKWFKLDIGKYKVLKNDLKCVDNMGNIVYLKENKIINIVFVSIDKNGHPYAKLKLNDEDYTIIKNDYYYLNYWLEKINE